MKKSNQPGGRLVIIGGAEERPGPILQEFVRLAGGPEDARIVVMTVASEQHDAMEEEYRVAFGKLGVRDIRVLETTGRADADRPESAAVVNRATGVFFTGGDQKRISQFLGKTKLEEALHQGYARGLIIAGTSAGASMMADLMMDEGYSEECPRAGVVTLGPGLGFLPGVIIDQHFSQRGRIGRLLTAVAVEPDRLGFGIGENVAMVVTGDEVEVIGDGDVTVVDLARARHNNLETREENQPLALWNVTLHSLSPGYRFDLASRTPLLPRQLLAGGAADGQRATAAAARGASDA
jgi:cyanophycinase